MSDDLHPLRNTENDSLVRLLSNQKTMLTLISDFEPYISPKGQKQRQVLCLCECGNLAVVWRGRFLSGSTKSCGCISAKKLTARNFKHGMSKTPEFTTWRAMQRRCTNVADASWEFYGGRGITVCPQWGEFDVFASDMGQRPVGTSLDRINVNGNYEPGNCRWASSATQARNTRTNVFTEKTVLAARQMKLSGQTNKQICLFLGVGDSALRGVLNETRWRL